MYKPIMPGEVPVRNLGEPEFSTDRTKQKNHFLFQNQRKALRQGVEMREEEKRRKEGLEQKEQ